MKELVKYSRVTRYNENMVSENKMKVSLLQLKNILNSRTN